MTSPGDLPPLAAGTLLLLPDDLLVWDARNVEFVATPEVLLVTSTSIWKTSWVSAPIFVDVIDSAGKVRTFDAHETSGMTRLERCP